MRQVKWTEAEPIRSWLKSPRDPWPDDVDYPVLREVKARLIQHGPRKKWCGAACNSGTCSHGKGMEAWDAEYINSSRLGPQRIAAVCRANNKYGFESMIYTWGADVIDGRLQHVASEILQRWIGVPLKAGDAGTQQALQVLHGTVVHHHHGAPEHIHHGGPAQQLLPATRKFSPTW